MKNKIFIFALLMLMSSINYAQPFKHFYPQLIENGKTLRNAYAGGFNSPQLSEVDLNKDGILDLFVFDRVGNAIVTYINNGTPNQTDYDYKPEFATSFPTLSQWVLLRDFDGDGISDIFTYTDDAVGMIAYKGFWDAKTLKFKKLTFYGLPFNVMNFDTPKGDKANIVISAQDYPSVDDVDGDGDLDILTFRQNGGYVEYYRNISVEKGWKRDSLRFVLEDNCFGGFYESGIGKPVKLSLTNGACVDPAAPEDGLHAGSTLLIYDKDNDGDKELILGDLSFANLNMLTNGGTKNKAWYSAQDNAFPANSTAVDLPVFPASFMLDCNNDGKKDLISAPNAPKAILDLNSIWYYPNKGTSTNPLFEFQQKDFLQSDMIDVGSGANPTFADINGDGLQDFIVGVDFTYQLLGNGETRLIYYQNIGTKTNPKFELKDDNYLNFKQYSSVTSGLTPTFGDLDADGDLDLLVGEESGTLFYLRNNAGANKPMAFGAIEIEYASIDVGLNATPHIHDVNRDGINDILVGNRNGYVQYFQNTGVKNSPIFAVKPTVEQWGKINTREPKAVSGFTAPFVLDYQAQTYIITGSEQGKLKQYLMPKDSIKGTFVKQNDNLGEVFEGSFSRPAFADIDGDNLLEMVVGNRRGGIAIYKTYFKTDGSIVANQDLELSENIKIYPNPSSSTLYIESNVDLDFQIYDLACNIVADKLNTASQNIDIQYLTIGIYMLKFEKNGVRFYKRFVKM